ncbi:MAG: hypothetical protein B7Z73_10100 [Planctomycetia bacterium 21-64-5]|nr:MAG: hypothetical protein B7Z73_10100 [Planctomycetia bacterium 21-64-5]HQU45867.1 hypothetical protein [Pirellulales bacterium]
MIDRSAAPADQPKPKGCMSVLLALVLAVLVFAGLFILTSGAVAPAAVAAVVIFGVAAFHYVVWGWWLSGIIRRQVEEEENDK